MPIASGEMTFSRYRFSKMSAPKEVLITTDLSGQMWNACVWDIHSGTSLLTYKGNSTGPRSLCVLGGDYLMGAVCNKPLLQVWALQKKEQIQMKMVCPGAVSSLAVTSDGAYCVAGIAEKIHVWQVASGNLLAVLSRHYQTVTCLRFTDDDSCFVSGGDDNLVIVWSLSSILCCVTDLTALQEPQYVWTGHALPVTDIHVGAGGLRARIVSSSLDQTCKMWDLSCGQLLCTVMFDVSIMCVTMDMPEYRLFAGGSNGTIFAVDLFAQPVKTERHVASSSPEDHVTCYRGHSKQVTCLCVSLDGSRLISGSHDTCIKVWDVISGQCIRTINQKGAVTNVISMLAPSSMFRHDIKPVLPLHQFKRHLHTGRDSGGDNSGESGATETVDIRISKVAEVLPTELPTAGERIAEHLDKEKESDEGPSLEERVQLLHQEVDGLKESNRELYNYALNKILQPDSKIT